MFFVVIIAWLALVYLVTVQHVFQDIFCLIQLVLNVILPVLHALLSLFVIIVVRDTISVILHVLRVVVTACLVTKLNALLAMLVIR